LVVQGRAGALANKGRRGLSRLAFCTSDIFHIQLTNLGKLFKLLLLLLIVVVVVVWGFIGTQCSKHLYFLFVIVAIERVCVLSVFLN